MNKIVSSHTTDLISSVAYRKDFPPLSAEQSAGTTKMGFHQKLYAVEVLPLQFGETLGFLGNHPAILLVSAGVSRLRNLESATNICDGLALDDQLPSGFKFADDLYSLEKGFGFGYVMDSFHSEDLGPVWPDEDSHLPWTDIGSHVSLVSSIKPICAQ